MMYRLSGFLKMAALTVSLLLLVAGCGKEAVEAGETDSTDVSVVVEGQIPVTGWLDVVLPSEPVAMDAMADNLWILTTQGIVMNWDASASEWLAVEADIPSVAAEAAFDIAATHDGAALLSPGALVFFSGEEASEVCFEEGAQPVSLCFMNDKTAVLFADGSVSVSDGVELLEISESAGKTVEGGFCYDENLNALAWFNTDGTASRFDVAESLLSEALLPESTTCIQMENGSILAGNGTTVSRFNGEDSWSECYAGSITGRGLLYTETGIRTFGSEENITAGLPALPETTCRLADGTVWSLSGSSISVWAEIGTVETRLPDADVQMLRYRLAGQTGSGAGTGAGINDAGVSFGGVFRIYESVSSRPDPFTEFPQTSRDLRRSLADLTIEELHLVGITIDPSGGDHAMVEDANGVAYVLQEGTVLRNNTHIAEITGNEVIVVQEVTVGSEDEIGGSTSIPTIFSMRLHEEGGL